MAVLYYMPYIIMLCCVLLYRCCVFIKDGPEIKPRCKHTCTSKALGFS